MADDRQLFALVAPRVPAIWDVLGPLSLNPQPLPPVAYSGLNPQPLPPEVFSQLNPQPLPPGPPPETYGAVVGKELVKLEWQAEKFGVNLTSTATWADDPAPAPPKKPSLPPWLPPVDDPNDAWLGRYYLGLACALAVADAGKTESGFIAGVFDRATTALSALGAGPSAPAPTTPPQAG